MGIGVGGLSVRLGRGDLNQLHPGGQVGQIEKWQSACTAFAR
jgi:hypothetical protein